jgi:hypothetical protein
MSAGEIDFAHDPLSDPRFVFCLGNLPHEFVAGSSGKPVVSALELEIGGADSGGEQPDACESMWDPRQRLLANFHASGFEVYGEHVV